MAVMGTVLTVMPGGEVTLSKDVLDHLGVSPGDAVEVDLAAPGKVEVRAKRKSSLGDFVGMLHDPNGPVLTIEEINEYAQRGWACEFSSDP